MNVTFIQIFCSYLFRDECWCWCTSRCPWGSCVPGRGCAGVCGGRGTFWPDRSLSHNTGCPVILKVIGTNLCILWQIQLSESFFCSNISVPFSPGPWESYRASCRDEWSFFHEWIQCGLSVTNQISDITIPLKTVDYIFDFVFGSKKWWMLNVYLPIDQLAAGQFWGWVFYCRSWRGPRGWVRGAPSPWRCSRAPPRNTWPGGFPPRPASPAAHKMWMKT